MHQSTQRRICRLVFLIGCILPTLAVMAWATVERLPSTAAARLTAVEHLLGMHVAAETIQTPKPGVFRASEVTLTNVETGAEVLLARLATIRPQTTATFVELSGVQVAAGELPLLAATVQRALAVDWPGDVRIQVANAAWLGESPAAGAALLASGPLTLTLRTNQHQGEVLGRELAVRLGDATSGPRFTAVRNRQLVPTATRISIHTAGQLVPAGWIAQLGGMVAAGKQASFAGEATITHTAGDTSGELSGTLSDVTLAVATQLPIDTRARIENLQAQWSSGRLIRAQGIVPRRAWIDGRQFSENVAAVALRTSAPPAWCSGRRSRIA